MIAAVLAATSAWVAFAVYSEAASGHALDDRVRVLQAQNATLRQQVSDREREIGAAKGSAWLEEEARKLGYVRPGEHIFILTPQGQPLRPAGGVDYKGLPTFTGGAPMPAPNPAPAAPVGAGTASPTPTPTPTPHLFALPPPGGTR